MSTHLIRTNNNLKTWHICHWFFEFKRLFVLALMQLINGSGIPLSKLFDKATATSFVLCIAILHDGTLLLWKF
jgi:hypothetical protein